MRGEGRGEKGGKGGGGEVNVYCVLWTVDGMGWDGVWY